MSFRSLLKPEIINSVAGLELIARTIVEGYLAGINQSIRVGIGQEFSQYRTYQPGDDPRLLDWKMFGRSDRYYIRESEVETNINVRFIIDASASMLHEDNGLSKMQYAKILAATLAYMALKQGDVIGLITLNENSFNRISDHQGKQHYHRFLYELIQMEASGRWPLNISSNLFSKGGHKEMLIFISDLYETDMEISKTLKQCKTSINEVLVLHLMGENEIKNKYDDIHVFEDLETGQIIQIDPAEADYTRKLQQSLIEIRKNMLDLQINYELFTLDQSIDSVLRLFLKRHKSFK